MWEWHKRSLRVNTRLQSESAINTIQYKTLHFNNLGALQAIAPHTERLPHAFSSGANEVTEFSECPHGFTPDMPSLKIENGLRLVRVAKIVVSVFAATLEMHHNKDSRKHSGQKQHGRVTAIVL